ncbi:hypothetical protein [Corynebacterium sp.]|uniref:hypothetical protein n=1 Tax=Corynebacterium sp. TaxID=1720 RepID=UPI0026DFD754|nr:hypothetical protein [Corynebacterium sp.]MDO5512128.1 hypothetical protein [Corynebacterium sp.]
MSGHRVRGTGIMVLALIPAGLGLSACGNLVDMNDYDYRGGLALGMNEAGDVIAHIEACDYRVNAVEIVQGRELLGGEPNPTLGRIVTDSPQSGRFEVNLSHPQAPWRAEQPLTEPPNPDHIMIVDPRSDGSVSRKIEVIRQEAASRTDLEALEPGEGIINVWNPDREMNEDPLIDEIVRLDEFAPECPA